MEQQNKVGISFVRSAPSGVDHVMQLWVRIQEGETGLLYSYEIRQTLVTPEGKIIRSAVLDTSESVSSREGCIKNGNERMDLLLKS